MLLDVQYLDIEHLNIMNIPPIGDEMVPAIPQAKSHIPND
jgi:hypothetical protein